MPCPGTAAEALAWGEVSVCWDRTALRGTQDGKRLWREGIRQNTSSSLSASDKNNTRNVKVMLWVLASIMTAVDGAHPRNSREVERTTNTRLVPDVINRPPAHLMEVEEQGEEGTTHSTWDGVFVNSQEFDREHHDRWQRSPSNSTPAKSSRKHKKKPKGSRDCRMERKEMRVRDLGLGFDSDEIVLFKYCTGTCRSSRMNYDLALKNLMDNGTIPKHLAKKVSIHPCCRPTDFEPVSFMDTQTKWRTIEFLSAASCSCVG